MRRIAIAAAAKKGLVHERGRLQGLVVVALAREANAGQLAQFVVHFGQHVARRAGVAVAGAVH
jgi:hypothetical protein